MPESCSNNCRPGKPEAVCIDTARVYDSCADRDCLSDLRVYFPEDGQSVLESALSVRCRSCDVINVFSEIEKVPFSTGYYSVDATYFFDVELDVYTSPAAAPVNVHGLSVYTKKSILYGADGSVKVFSSEYAPTVDAQNPMAVTSPRAKIQVATPIPLDASICDPADCCGSLGTVTRIPEAVKARFGGEMLLQDGGRTARVTIGLFTIVRLERDVQLLIPACEFCMPTKECDYGTEDPCDAFRRIAFPVNEFFPPEADGAAPGDPPVVNSHCGCGK